VNGGTGRIPRDVSPVPLDAGPRAVTVDGQRHPVASSSPSAPDMTPSVTPAIQLRDVVRHHVTPAGTFIALDGVTLDVPPAAFTAIVGQSGSGKSTLLSLVAGLDRPTRGEVIVGGTAVHALDERALTAWRARAVGIVFQFFQLLPTLTVLENVMLPMDFAGRWPRDEQVARARALLERLEIADHAGKVPATLSGGQQQRVAIARALANEPAVLLADEPTGNLDSRTAASMLDLFASLADQGQTVVMVTHDAQAQRRASGSITLADGKVVAELAHA
jgi:putative ABC transport system ATP-binding protein